jgi:predicted ester cyclase
MNSDPDRRFDLVRSYAEAKSRQDVAAALAICHPSFSIETIPFGTESRDRDETAAQLGLFFSVFPDYRADTEGLAAGDGCVTWWGTITLSFEGPLLGVPPTGRTTTVPAFSVFEFREEQLSKERFFFDLVSLCDGIGASVEDVTGALAGLRAAAA